MGNEEPREAAANKYTFGDNLRASARLRRLAEMYEPESRELLRRSGRLYIVSWDDRETDFKASAIPELPARYFGSSDTQNDRAQLLAGRREGHFLVSYETLGGWVAIKKDLLTGWGLACYFAPCASRFLAPLRIPSIA